MVRITIELIPYGLTEIPYGMTENRKILGSVDIANEGTGSKQLEIIMF